MTPPLSPAHTVPQPPRDIYMALVVAVALLLACGAYSWRAGRNVDAALATLQQSHAMEAAIGQVLMLTTDAETGQRGFILTGDNRYLSPYEAAEGRFDAALQRLQQLAADDPDTAPDAVPRVAALSAGVAIKRDQLRQTIAQRREQGFEAARATVDTHLGKQTMEALRAQAAVLTVQAAARASAALQATQTQQRRAAVAAWATTLMALAATLALGVLGARNRRAAAQVAAERARLRSVVDAMPTFVGLLAADGTVLDANDAPLRASGLQRSDVVGLKFWDCPWWTHDPAVQQRQREAFERASAGHTVRFDETIRVQGEGGRDARTVIAYTLQPVFSDGVLTMLVPSATDISARVQAEQAVRDSEMRARERAEELQVLMAALPVAVFIARDPMCAEVVGNPHAYQLLGMPQDSNLSASAPGDMPQRQPFQEFRQGRPLDTGELPLQRAARDAVDVNLEEISFVFADGTVKHLLGSARPLRNAEGAVRGAISAFVEITDFRRAQEQLRERDLQITSVADNSPDILARFDRGLRHVFVSAAVTRATGIRPEVLIGRTNAELDMPQPQCAQWDAALRAVFETGQPGAIEFELDGPGGVRHFRSRLVPERDAAGAVAHVLGVTTDVSETVAARSAATAALLQAEHRADEAESARRLLQGILEFIPEGLVIAEPGANGGVEVQMVSRFASEMLSQTRSVLAGTLAQTFETWGLRREDGTVPALHELPIARAVHQGEVVLDEEWQLHRSDGQGVSVLCSAGPIRDEAGRIVAGVVAWRDISPLKRVLSELRDADRRKDEFLATLAHELRNPLAPLRNGLQMLQQTSDPAVAARMREMMTRQLSHMVRLVDDLLDVSRITSGKVALRLEHLSLRVVAGLAVESARPLIEGARHTLVCDFPAQDLWVHGDPHRLAQVMGNLLTNATKYTPQDPPGGGRIVLKLQAQGEQALISVSDNGLGIPPHLLDEVFGMFTQVNHTLDRAQGGLGIGLALVKKLVQLHGGEVVAASEGEGHGSVFTVSLPRLQAMAVPAPGAAPAASLAASSAASSAAVAAQPVAALRLLVVDDNQDGADSLAELLAALGYSTRTVYSGRAALAAARDFNPDWVLLDIGLPDLDGHEVARALAADPLLCRARRVAVSGWGSEADLQRSRAAGFAHHLTKPVEPAALLALLADPNA